MRSKAYLIPIRAYLDALVHPGVRHDALATARHRALFATKLFVGLVVLALLPIYLAWRGAPGPIEAAAFAWMLSPFFVVWYLSRSGNFECAHLLSAFALAVLIAMAGTMTGGVTSFVAPWIVVLPLEASLSGSRRTIAVTITLALATALGLWFAEAAGLLPSVGADTSAAALFGTLSAALYAGSIALANSAFFRAGDDVKQASEARYRLLAQNMSDVIARHGRDGAVTFISPAVEQLAGVPAAQLLGHNLFERIHLADRPAFLTAISDAARRDEPVSVEYRLRRGDHEQPHDGAQTFVWVEMRCRAIEARTGSGSATARQVVSVIRDISSRKSDALALDAARQDAERANDAKSKFLATVSHELRTPLNAIIGFSEMLSREAEMKIDAARRQDYARLIRDSGEHLLAVVNGILDMSRIEAGHFEIVPEPFDLHPLIDSCREMMSLKAEQAGIQLFVDLPEFVPEVTADPRALRQILINLLSNAIKFTERGGKVDVMCRVNGGELTLVVADTGIGIPEEDIGQLGNPFFQVRSSYDRAYEGTGLGLSVVMGLVKLHGGKVEIESRLRKGTKIVVRLPLSVERATTAQFTGQISRFPARTALDRENAEDMKVRKSA